AGSAARVPGTWAGGTRVARTQPVVSQAGAIERAREAAPAVDRGRSLHERWGRPQPARDDKALAAWNGLAIGALADGGRVLEAVDPAAAGRFREAAARAADTILAGLRRSDGRLGRSWKDGRSSGEGVLEDYADLAEGLLGLYGATCAEARFGVASE